MTSHFDDERLLEWLLNPATRDERTRAVLDADDAARQRLERLSQFVDHCRDTAEDLPEGTSSAQTSADEDLTPLTARVLDCTTREDLTWRGDLSLYGRYLHRRLAESAWLRLAAASLLLHLLALPAVAVYLLVVEPKAAEFGYVPWDEYYPAGFPEEAERGPTPALDALGDEPEVPEPEVPEVEGGR
jgi:hypothetical protein